MGNKSCSTRSALSEINLPRAGRGQKAESRGQGTENGRWEGWRAADPNFRDGNMPSLPAKLISVDEPQSAVKHFVPFGGAQICVHLRNLRFIARFKTARNPLPWVGMSLNRLLSFVPLARRLVPQRRDSDDQASSDAFMISLSMNLLAAVWGLMLLVSATALIVIACLTPGVAFFSTTDARDAEIQSIKSVNDVGLLQQKAVYDVSQGSASSVTATYLCHIALWALLFMMIGSIAGLLLVRWIKRHLSTVADDTDAGPARATIELLNRLKRTEGES